MVVRKGADRDWHGDKDGYDEEAGHMTTRTV